MPAQQIQVGTAVVRREQHRLTIVIALSEMVRDTGNDDARTAGHTDNVSGIRACYQESAVAVEMAITDRPPRTSV